MKEQYFDEAMVILNVTPDLESVVVDWLLSRGSGTGFTSFPVFGHSTSHEGLSPAEQVSGRERRVQFEIQVYKDQLEDFVRDAYSSLGKTGMRCWILPLILGEIISDILEPEKEND